MISLDLTQVQAARADYHYLNDRRLTLPGETVEHADGRRPWGLDISVRDAETGQSRPATTLSGGETFMAALALALGLADVVSAGSNYSIGALFVDEGFGSLDEETLDLAVRALEELREHGRLVGVISHVPELRRRIPARIEVVRTADGSRAIVHAA